MKALALLLLGSIATAVVLALLLLLFRPRQRELPAYWVGLVSALAWLPAFVYPPIKAALAKDPMPAFDWVIAVAVILPVLGVWTLLCSIVVRITASAYARLRGREEHEQQTS